MDIRPPLITGQTVGEQVQQLIAYLTRLARQLCELPESQTVEVKKETEVSNRNTFQKLRVRKELTAEGGVNGVYARSLRVMGTTSFTLRTRFSNWNGNGNTRQTFLISSCLNSVPLLGVVRVSDNGTGQWDGTSGVTVSTEGGGVLRVKLPVTLHDYVLVQSPQEFYI